MDLSGFGNKTRILTVTMFVLQEHPGFLIILVPFHADLQCTRGTELTSLKLYHRSRSFQLQTICALIVVLIEINETPIK
jgi:hypothetical protein